MIAEIFLLSFLIFKNIYENSKYNKNLWKIKSEKRGVRKKCKTPTLTPREPLGATGQRGTKQAHL